MNGQEDVLRRIRKEIFLAGYAAGKAHLASAFSLVEILAALYLEGIVRFDPRHPNSPERDTLILSKGHGSLALYAVLVEAGILPHETLMSFCQPGSPLGGEPVLGIAGIEATTGSLGHGLSLGVGEALAHKLDDRKNRVFVILGDGECEEGSVWEAAMSAARYELDNLIVVVDCNRIQKMGPVEEIAGVRNWAPIWASLGWDVREADGHDTDMLVTQLRQTVDARDGVPHVIIAHTEKGKGSTLMEGSSAWHWRLPKRRELKVFMSDLDISEEEIKACKRHT